MKQNTLVLLTIFSSAIFTIQSYPNHISLNLEQFMRLRCSLNPDEEVVTTWKGSAYLHLYQSMPKNLFNIIGMNIARCLVDEKNRQIILATREAQLYTDVSSGKKLVQWQNPYTQQTVSVIHVSNDPVQSTLPMDGFTIDGYLSNENKVILPIDVNLYYPNPLFSNETLRFYSKEQYYEAGEYFKFFTSFDQLVNESSDSVHQLDISWTRVAPILPWMNMSQTFNGTLIFSAQGSKVHSLTDIDETLYNEIIQRIPLYQHAPNCLLNTTSETSWTYFKKYFQEYISNRQEFPIPKATEDIPCVV